MPIPRKALTVVALVAAASAATGNARAQHMPDIELIFPGHSPPASGGGATPPTITTPPAPGAPAPGGLLPPDFPSVPLPSSPSPPPPGLIAAPT